MFLTVQVRSARGRPVFIWLPLILLWLLLSPLIALALVVLFVAAAVFETNPFRATGAIIAAFCALSGTRVEIDSPDSRVLVNIV